MEPTVLQYAQPSRVSRMAIASFVIGLIALPLFAFVVPALIALARFGGTPATPLFPRYPEIPFSSTYPNAFDIIMVPVRNATTGAM